MNRSVQIRIYDCLYMKIQMINKTSSPFGECVGWNLFQQLEEPTPPPKLKRPLKNSGWKTIFLFEMTFVGDIR